MYGLPGPSRNFRDQENGWTNLQEPTLVYTNTKYFNLNHARTHTRTHELASKVLQLYGEIKMIEVDNFVSQFTFSS